MIKDELLQTHRLLDALVAHIEEKGAEVDTPRYEDVEVGPCEVFKNKKEHRLAVEALGYDLNEELDEIDVEGLVTDEATVTE